MTLRPEQKKKNQHQSRRFRIVKGERYIIVKGSSIASVQVRSHPE